MQARFEHLEARGRAQSDLHAGSVDRLEETNRQMRDMRRALQDIAHEKVSTSNAYAECNCHTSCETVVMSHDSLCSSICFD